MGKDTRTTDEIICDFVSEIDDDYGNEHEVWVMLAYRLGWSVYAAKRRFEQIREGLGWQAS